MTYLTNQLMFWGASKISDHNRQPLNRTVERLEQSGRMTNGRMRRNVVAKKYTFQTSWENFPARTDASTGPVDGGLSGEEMQTFLEDNDKSFTLTLRDGEGVTVSYQVMVTDFSFDTVKRGEGNDWWNISVTLVEV